MGAQIPDLVLWSCMCSQETDLSSSAGRCFKPTIVIQTSPKENILSVMQNIFDRKLHLLENKNMANIEIFYLLFCVYTVTG